MSLVKLARLSIRCRLRAVSSTLIADRLDLNNSANKNEINEKENLLSSDEVRFLLHFFTKKMILCYQFLLHFFDQ
jgi:hypothetical protein